jgi:hypothetical protein
MYLQVEYYWTSVVLPVMISNMVHDSIEYPQDIEMVISGVRRIIYRCLSQCRDFSSIFITIHFQLNKI